MARQGPTRVGLAARLAGAARGTRLGLLRLSQRVAALMAGRLRTEPGEFSMRLVSALAGAAGS